MKEKGHTWIRQPKILAYAVGSALLLHSLGIYSLYDMPIEFEGFGGGGLAAFLQKPSAPEEEVQKERRELREDELASILNAMQKPPEPEEIDPALDLSDLDLEVLAETENPFTDMEELNSERDVNLLTIDEELTLDGGMEVTIGEEEWLSDTADGGSGGAFNVDEVLEATDVVPGMEDRASWAAAAEAEGSGGEDASGVGASASKGGARRGAPAAGSIASSLDFTLNVTSAQAENGDGYVFEIQFLPKEEVAFRRIKQNLFFLIDRSHSIPQRRFEAAKYAVMDSLAYLQPGDTFNILVFDRGVERLAEQTLAATPENIEQARKFLHDVPYGGFFASTDLYSSLDRIVPKEVSDYEVNTAILMTDGDTLLSQEKQRRAIENWTASNAGKVALYTVAAGGGNHLPLLQFLSGLNKGSLHYSEAEVALKDQLIHLVQSIQQPIGKDMVASVVTDDGRKVTLFPSDGRMPDLYRDQPYALYGRAESLDDFHLFLQGKYYGRWLDIKHTVQFPLPKTVDRSIERRVVLAEAYDLYRNYLRDGRSRHVTEANRLLRPMRIPNVFR